MKTILIEGALAQQVGSSTLQLDVQTPLEAIRAIILQFPPTRTIIQENSWAIRVDGELRNLETCKLHGGHEYEISPAIAGASGRNAGIALTVLGAALIIGSFFVPGTQGAGLLLLKGSLMVVGSAVMSYGTSTLFAQDVPKSDDDKTRQSWAASPTNTSLAGAAIPVVYGRMRVGSLVISTELITEKLPYSYKS